MTTFTAQVTRQPQRRPPFAHPLSPPPDPHSHHPATTAALIDPPTRPLALRSKRVSLDPTRPRAVPNAHHGEARGIRDERMDMVRDAQAAHRDRKLMEPQHRNVRVRNCDSFHHWSAFQSTDPLPARDHIDTIRYETQNENYSANRNLGKQQNSHGLR
jgi:hypothetical protein